MNGAQLHLLVNHAPILAPVLAVFLMAVYFLWRREGLVQAALLLLLAGGVGAVVANLSGEPAEEVVEEMAGVSETRIHAHEEAAEIAWLVAAVIGLGALWALVAYRKRAMPGWVPVATLTAALVIGGWMGYVGHLGGTIRHPETRGTFGLSAGAPVSGDQPVSPRADDD